MIDQRRDEMWDDYFAASDAIRERYAAELDDLKQDALAQQEHDEYMDRVWHAGFGRDWFAYEEQWRRTMKYYEDLNEDPNNE